MLRWLQVALTAASVILVFVIVLSCILRRAFRQRKHAVDDVNLQESGQTFEIGISRIPHLSIHHDRNIDQDNLNITKKKTSNYFVLRRGFSGKNAFFSWSDHPSLVADAVENGWSSFGFSPTIYSSPSISKSRSLLGSCVVGDNQSIRDMDIDKTWEICQQGSADFGQMLKFNNQELKKKGHFSVIKTSLPLPGPSLGNISSFPQECYFEITILSLHNHNVSGQELSLEVKEDHEGDKIKLMEEDYNAKTDYSSESLIHVSSTHRYGDKEIDEMKHAMKENEKVEATIILSVGLTAAGGGGGGGNVPIKLPGSYPGSIGFNSNGSVLLDGMKLVLESPMQEWEKPEKVIGCGYNPSKRKVYFTIDSQLVHEIHCKSDAFSTPLYPTLASNADITVLVNLGQSAFSYEPANLQRTSNPCFIGPLVKSPTLGFDSGELFSMRRVDSHHWLNRNATRNTTNGTVGRGLDYEEESDGDLFEITLERPGRSPYTFQ